MVAVGSLSARPMRFSPWSIARILICHSLLVNHRVTENFKGLSQRLGVSVANFRFYRVTTEIRNGTIGTHGHQVGERLIFGEPASGKFFSSCVCAFREPTPCII